VKKPRFHLCNMVVVGTQYRDQRHLAGIGEADPLELCREPENIYDANAVAVHCDGVAIGFVPKEYAQIISALLDNDVRLQAAVDYAGKGVVSMDLWMIR